jgi:hypothetical protein
MTETQEGSGEAEGELAAALEGLETELAYTLVRLAVENKRADFDALIDAARLSPEQMDRIWRLIRRAVEGGSSPKQRS